MYRGGGQYGELNKKVPLEVRGQRHWGIVCGDKLGLLTNENCFHHCKNRSYDKFYDKTL